MNYRDVRTTDTEKSGIDLSATMEALLADHVATQQQARTARQQDADSCSADWNAVHAVMGSFADEHSTL